MVTIYFDPIETQKKVMREALEDAPSLLSSQEAHPWHFQLHWASAAKKIIALAGGLVTPDNRQAKIEMGV
jgi:hypothetical protein